MKLYVGNLPWSMTDSDLERLFGEVGPTTSARVVTDRETGRSRGFGFVEMDKADAVRAMSKFNGYEVDSRPLKVNEANDKPSRPSRY